MALTALPGQLATGKKIRVLTVVDTFSRYVPVLDPRFSGDLAIDVAAMTADLKILQRVRAALAASSGPIVRFVTQAIDPAAYVHERAICVDTTAAGGNANCSRRHRARSRLRRAQ